jgi:dolichol kinase
MAAWNFSATGIFLLSGCLVYTVFEILRILGKRVPVVSALTERASRPRDAGRFVTGPVTLGLGAFFSLVLFPPQIAAISIYALAFGDGFAGLVGRVFGRIRPDFLRGKSFEGSFACLAAVFISAYAVSGSIRISAIAAVSAVIVEALPLGDYDNIIMPLAVGFSLIGLIR